MKTHFAALLLLLTILPSQAQRRWELRRPLPTPNGLLGATYGNGLFVAVGRHNTVVTSQDAVNWMSLLPESERRWIDVAYGNGRFVAVGNVADDGESVPMLISANGATWEEYRSQSGFLFSGLAFANGAFIGFGVAPENDAAVIATSPDGLAWTERWRGSRRFRSISRDQGNFHAIGTGTIVVNTWDVSSGSESFAFLVSTNGVNWSGVMPAPLGDSDPPSIAYGNGRFVAVARGPGDKPESANLCVTVSSDGLVWEKMSIPLESSGQVLALAFGDGKFVCLAARYATLHDQQQEIWVLTSPDGRTWENTPADGIPRAWISEYFLESSSFIHAQGLFVLAGQPQVGLGSQNDFAKIMTSPDGIHWTRRVGGVSYFFDGVAGEHGLVAIGSGLNDTGTVVLTSKDGRDWEENQSLAGNFYDIAAGAGSFVAVGSDGIFTSRDGKSWTAQPGATPRFGQVRYSGGTFIVFGGGGEVADPYAHVRLSSDGISWTNSVVTAATELWDAASDGAQVLAIGGGPYTFFRSVDGTNWTRSILASRGRPTQLAYGNGRFVALDRLDQKLGTLVSTNGIDWARHARPDELAPLAGLIFANGRFYVADVFGETSGGRVFSSPDGLKWTTHRTGFYQTIEKLTAGPTGMFAFGQGEVIIHSPWDLVVGLNKVLAGGALELEISGTLGHSFALETAVSLAPAAWQPLSTNIISTSPLTVTDPDAAKSPQRFYRAVAR